jgi:glycosyltransferase involved in cell wall biosynthesis
MPPSTAATDDGGPTIGVYHPAAGSRSSGGVVVFVQETVPELASSRPTYLYTNPGPFARELSTSRAHVLPVGREESGRLRSAGTAAIRRLTSGSIAESVAFFAAARADGTLDHIEETIDVLFTHDAIDTLLLSNGTDVPVVRLYHAFYGQGAAGNLVGRLSRPAATVANSQQTAETLADAIGHEVDGIAYPGVNLETFSPSGPHAFETDTPVVLFVGLITEAKGAFDLLEAFAELSTNAELLLVGRGDRNRVRRECAALGIESSVTLAGEVDHSALPRYYRAADIVSLPTHNETFGMVNLEAMACGTAVLTTDLPGIRQYATDGRSCLLVPPGDVDRLAKLLKTLVASPSLRRELG